MKKLIPYIAFILLLLVACNEEVKEESTNLEEGQVITPDEEKKVTEEDELKEEEEESEEASVTIEADPLPSNFKELEALPVGKYAGKVYLFSDGLLIEEEKILEEVDGIPDIPEEPTSAELDYVYRELLKLVQEDFNGPDKLLKEMKFQFAGNPEIEDTRFQFKDQLNISILLDASGSMAQEVNGKTKMAAAKDAIVQFLEALPTEANVGLRVYGHKGTGDDSDKELSCSSSEIIYDYKSYESGAFKEALNKVNPAGWTPNGLALKEAQNDLADFDGKQNTNIVYLVSDGIETCETNPVEAAKNLYNSNITPIINVLGFDVDNEGQNHLQEIADSVEGIYQTVRDESELTKELDKINQLAEAWSDWKEQNQKEAGYKETQNSLAIFSYIVDQGLLETQEREAIYNILHALKEAGEISSETFHKLDKKNSAYHRWVREEMDSLEQELDDLNEASYQESIEAIEEKYQMNAE
ncbi:vWA domain-containing protein [Saliterribacillus persicus]|uniref:Ca-activated chloride channel family protein n=1 Tax=Saliterribacillus persicus TaxID=930114 RepID=A0A368XCZ7_9BACI|nr:VWA domain-containing protein [Saliterribacillus persicus]RCW65841.1 Ca-activated chloride channel family protein [Saliterribacillus persicus]